MARPASRPRSSHLAAAHSAPWAMHPEARLTAVAAAWARLGAGFRTRPTAGVADPERLVVETARVAPDDERLFVVAATWLGMHHHFINGRRLAALATALGTVGPPAADRETSAVLGALLSWADEIAGAGSPFAAVAARCRPVDTPQPLFRVVALLPSMAADAERRAVPPFARWGLWHDDVRAKPEAVKPTAWLVANAPELRIRAVVGPTLEADVLCLVLLGGPGATSPAASGATARDVARAYGVSYAAAHQSVEHLVGRGLLTRERDGARQVLRATRWAAGLLAAFAP